MAKIHNFDYSQADLSAFEIPKPGTQCAAWGVDWWERVWEEDGDEEIPLLRIAAVWLRRNLPQLDKPTLVHSDYRLGNFLFTERNCEITALLDWELGRIGDRHQDLAWTTSKAFATMDPSGKTPLVCSMLPEAEFFEAYEKASGFSVDPKALHWYKVYNNFSLAILIIGSGYRVARNAKTHQDVLLSWLMGIGYMVLDEMRSQIEQGITMQLRSEIQLATMMRSMKDVVIPAIEPGNQLAQEQAQLIMGMLNLMSRQLPLQYRFDRDELTRLIDYTDRLATHGGQNPSLKNDFQALSQAAESARQLLSGCGTDPAELHRAIKQLRENISELVKSVSAVGDDTLMSSIEPVILELSREQLLRDRSLLLDQGWEPEPESIPDIETLLSAD